MYRNSIKDLCEHLNKFSLMDYIDMKLVKIFGWLMCACVCMFGIGWAHDLSNNNIEGRCVTAALSFALFVIYFIVNAVGIAAKD